MKKDITTRYLALFLIVDVVTVGLLLCFCSQKEWWNNWMVMAPNLYMILGALFCPMMRKNLDVQASKQTWLLVYKGIKMVVTIAMVLLYIFFVKQSAKVFIMITAVAYLLALILETYCILHYLKQLQSKS